MHKAHGSGITANQISTTRIPLSRLCIAPLVFQVRADADKREIAQHVHALRRGLRRAGKLDAIEVFPIAGNWFCIDGHCRLSAYEAEKPDAIVPLTVFRGDFDGALVRALELNTKDKLRISDATKFNRAWHLVKRFTRKGMGSQRGLAEKTGVGKTTIEKMQRALTLAKALTFDVWGATSWALVKARVFHGWKPDTTADKSEQLVQRIRNALARAVGKRLRRHSDELREALSAEFSDEIAAIVRHRISQLSARETTGS